METAVLRAALDRIKLLLVVFSCVAVPCFGGTKYPKPKKEPGADFFSEAAMRTFNFEISETALNQLRRSPRSYVVGTVREGDRVLTNVAIRIKGMGSFRTIDEKPSLAVKFDEFATNQHYRGLSKLMFNNSVQDSSYLAEMLATQLFRDAKLPAARVTHAKVQLNGRELGLYVVIEAMGKQFLKQHFDSGEGNLYEAYLGDIDSRMEQDSGVRGDQSDVRKLFQVCSITNPDERWPQLGKVLDVERFVSFAAMEMLTTHWDGYTIHTNNYRVYHDPKTDKFVFITHGLDWAFRRPNISIYPPAKSIVGRAALETSEGQALYHERIATLFTNVFRVPVITNRIERALTKIRKADLAPNDMANIERRAALMRERVMMRATNVADQLAGVPPRPLKFDANNVVSLRGWRDEPDRGEPIIDRVTFDGKDTLHIKAGGPRTRASWRSQVYLARGWYRFEGNVRTELSGGSARIRISGDTRSVGISGRGGSWRPLAHVFEVADAGMDIELVCELNAIDGDAWFDTESLRVKRLAPEEVSKFRPAGFQR